MLRLVLPALFICPALIALAAAPAVPGFRLDRRVALTGSRVVGSPEPPLPYRTRRVFEKLSFRAPVYLAGHPVDDRLFVVGQWGRVVSFRPGADKARLFCELKDIELYSMAFHPEYRTNRLVYLFGNGPVGKPKRTNRIYRFRVALDPPRCDPATKQLVIEWPSNGHNGGDLAFGTDGMLYLSSGDGTSDSDGDVTGQDLRDLCSGILRIDVDRSAPGKNYAVPRDNPFLHVQDARPELWAFGLRNPWRMSFDRATGDLYIGDVGQDLWEMVYLGRRGANYGWSVMEGSKPFQPLRRRGPGPFVAPLIEHPHSEARSMTGGIVYTGKRLPGLAGTYIYGDYSTGKIWGLRQKGGKVTWKGELASTRLQIVGFGADRQGELYIVDHPGQIHQLEPMPPGAGHARFPRRLSESGLFTAVAGYHPHPALIPYAINSPLWSDGTHKERHMAIPGLKRVGFTESGPWEFPERTVLVKTFAIDRPEGTRRRIETRFLTLQQGEWYGYSYAWNDEQTDAELVGPAGRDETFPVRDERSPGGKSDLKWRFPSRVECMVCHTRAANYVLGLTTAQMNREHDYAGTRHNQLAALEGLGVFRVGKALHWQALQQRGTPLARLGGNALRFGVLAPLHDCCLEPAGKRLREAFDTARRRLEPKGGDTTRLPRRPDEYPHLADPYAPGADLDARARSYLQSNCAHCHVDAGGGNAAINLHADTPRAKMRLVGERPLHDRFGIADALLVAPGAPQRSILYHRVSRRGTGQMPPLASSRVDARAAELLAEWIRAMK